MANIKSINGNPIVVGADKIEGLDGIVGDYFEFNYTSTGASVDTTLDLCAGLDYTVVVTEYSGGANCTFYAIGDAPNRVTFYGVGTKTLTPAVSAKMRIYAETSGVHVKGYAFATTRFDEPLHAVENATYAHLGDYFEFDHTSTGVSVDTDYDLRAGVEYTVTVERFYGSSDQCQFYAIGDASHKAQFWSPMTKTFTPEVDAKLRIYAPTSGTHVEGYIYAATRHDAPIIALENRSGSPDLASLPDVKIRTRLALASLTVHDKMRIPASATSAVDVTNYESVLASSAAYMSEPVRVRTNDGRLVYNNLHAEGTNSTGAQTMCTFGKDGVYLRTVTYTQLTQRSTTFLEDEYFATLYEFPDSTSYQWFRWYVDEVPIGWLDRPCDCAYTEEAAAYSALVGDSEETEQFLYFTDPHITSILNDKKLWNEEFEQYLDFINTYAKSTPSTFVMCGGDWLINKDKPSVAKWKLGVIYGGCKRFDRFYNVVGNHDTNYQGTDEAGTTERAGRLPDQTVNNLFFGGEHKSYYAFDGTHTRFYVFDSWLDNDLPMNAYRWEQIDWFATALASEDRKHSAVSIHIWWPDYRYDTLAPMSEAIEDVIEAYNGRTSVTLNGTTYDFSSCTGHIEFVICGHTHIDKAGSTAGIPVVNVTKMRGGYVDAQNPGEPDVPSFNRVTPTFDLVYADYDNRVLKTVRVGTGDDRTFDLDVE